MWKEIKVIGVYSLCAAMLCACSEKTEPEEEINLPVELNINTSIELTRSVVTSAQFGTGSSIAVYANSATTNKTENNYTIYKYGGTSWAADGNVGKIYLSAEKATIYAHYPAYEADGSTPIKVSPTSDITAGSTIAVSLLEGTEANADNDNTITVAADSKDNINAAPGETDYMYGTNGNGSTHTEQPQADNGKGSNPAGLNVKLQMNHAMSMVSFRLYNDGTYTNTSKLTKIKLDNASGSQLNKGTKAVMKLGDGGITVTGTTNAVLTRYIYTGTAGSSTAGFVLKSSDKVPGDENNPTYPSFGFLVYPAASSDKSSIRATFTVDGTDYPVTLPSGAQEWAKGKNHIYTVKLNGKELTISGVTVVDWSNEIVGDLTPIQ